MTSIKNAAIVLILTPDRQRMLLVKRRDFPVWVLPGGGIDPAETPEQAALREAWEETGFTCHITRKIAHYHATHRLTQDIHFFEAAVVSGQPLLSDETQAIAFFAPEAPPSPFFFLHEACVRDALRHGSEPLDKPLPFNYGDALGFTLRHPWIAARFLVRKLEKKSQEA